MKNSMLTVIAILLSISLIHAQENKETKDKNSKQESLHVKLKDGAKPDIYVNGKKFDFQIDLLDPNKIESVTVLKDIESIKKYNAKNGVILIETKKNMDDKGESQVRIRDIDSTKTENPLVIIDGKKSNQEMLKKLSPDDIKSIEVIKGEQALKKYSAPNGVIVVTTKKRKEN